MKKALVFVFAAALATSVFAQGNNQGNNDNNGNDATHGNGHHELNGPGNAGGQAARGSNLTYHSGGKVLRNAHVVMIFWGSFPSGYTTNMQNFRNQFGTTGEYNTITQYYQIVGVTQSFIQLANLGSGTPDMFDTSTPPTNVTDADVQAKESRHNNMTTFGAAWAE